MSDVVRTNKKPIPSKWKAGDASPLHMHMQQLGRCLNAYAYRYADEVKLHESLATVLTEAGHSFHREWVFDKENRADFFLPDTGIAIEVKVDGSLSDALRQIDRYLHLDNVQAVLLASTQRWAEQRLHARLAWQEKPFHMIRLRRQCL